jgi:hypothetical protein
MNLKQTLRSLALVLVLVLLAGACSSSADDSSSDSAIEDVFDEYAYTIDGVGSATCGLDATLSIDCGFTLDDGVQEIPIGTVRAALEAAAASLGYTVDLSGTGIVVQAWGGKGNQTGAVASTNSTGMGGAAQTFVTLGNDGFLDTNNLYVYLGSDGSTGGGGAATVVTTTPLLTSGSKADGILLIAGGGGGSGQQTGSVWGNLGASGCVAVATSDSPTASCAGGDGDEAVAAQCGSDYPNDGVTGGAGGGDSDGNTKASGGKGATKNGDSDFAPSGGKRGDGSADFSNATDLAGKFGAGGAGTLNDSNTGGGGGGGFGAGGGGYGSDKATYFSCGYSGSGGAGGSYAAGHTSSSTVESNWIELDALAANPENGKFHLVFPIDASEQASSATPTPSPTPTPTPSQAQPSIPAGDGTSLSISGIDAYALPQDCSSAPTLASAFPAGCTVTSLTQSGDDTELTLVLDYSSSDYSSSEETSEFLQDLTSIIAGIDSSDEQSATVTTTDSSAVVTLVEPPYGTVTVNLDASKLPTVTIKVMVSSL